MGSGAEADWQRLRAAADHMQHKGCGRSDTDLGELRLAVQCLHAPQRLCGALGLPAPGLDGGADAASAVAEPGTTVWHQRAVMVTTLVQQLVVTLLSSMQVRACYKLCCLSECTLNSCRHQALPTLWKCSQSGCAAACGQAALALLGLSNAGITPPADVAAAAVADRVVELLAIHAELSAAVAAASGAICPCSAQVLLVYRRARTAMTMTQLQLGLFAAAGGASRAAPPLAVPEACQLMHFAAAQLSTLPAAVDLQSRRRSSRQSSGVAGAQADSARLQQSSTIPLDLAAYAVTLAQAAVVAAPDGQAARQLEAAAGGSGAQAGHDLAIHRLAVAAWRVYSAAGGVRLHHASRIAHDGIESDVWKQFQC